MGRGKGRVGTPRRPAALGRVWGPDPLGPPQYPKHPLVYTFLTSTVRDEKPRTLSLKLPHY
jgi:hypothetical protein